MTINQDINYLHSLVRELCALPQETEWVEFKHNNDDPEAIGEYISALANAAALQGKVKAYIIWGVNDQAHNFIGTQFIPSKRKIGNEELENWLLKLLSPKIDFHFYELKIDNKPMVLLEIMAAFRHPVTFKGQEFIRVSSYKKKLKDYPEKERALWRIFDRIPFEQQIAAEHISGPETLRILDYPAYFDLLKLPLPESRDAILQALKADKLIIHNEAGQWNITNFGAILFAKRLSDFGRLKYKTVRVIVYRGENRIETIREQEGSKGYACGFVGLISFILNLLPSNEVIGQALRVNIPMFPELAIRELVANALIHQDFQLTGTGVKVEIFSNRIEITNPGVPLVKTERFLDSPPISRNEAIASFMRRIGICEERGSGVDKVVFETEFYQLPAPIFEVTDEHTCAVLFSHRELKDMDKDDRIRACYLHACLKFVQREFMTNASLRKRFGIEEKNSAIASRIIKESIAGKKIRPYDESASRKLMKYVPWWNY